MHEKNPSIILNKCGPWRIKIYQLKHLSLKIRASTTISTYLRIVKAPTLNLSTMMFALTPCANWYNTSSNGALTNIIALELTKGSNSLTKYINVSWITRYANKYFWSLISKLVCQTTPFIKSQFVDNPNDVNRWTNEQDHLSKKTSLKIFHAMSWNILGIFVFHMANFKVMWQNIPWHVIKYFATSPKYFLESTKVY